MNMTVQLGEHIDNACNRAIEMAKATNSAVAFTFNDINLEAKPESSSLELLQEFGQRSNQRAEEYRRSPAGIKAAKDAAKRLKVARAAVVRLTTTLPTAVTKLDTLIDWLAEFSVAADHIGVKPDLGKIAAVIVAAGYSVHWGVGNPPDWFDSRDRMGRYIVGQALDYLSKGNPPHPLCHTFAERYRRLPA